MRIHERARAERKEKGLSEQKFAALAEIQRSLLQKFERGDNVTRETMEKALTPLGLYLVAVTAAELDALRTLGRLSALLPDRAPAPPLPPLELEEGTEIRPELREKFRQLDQLVELGRDKHKHRGEG